MSTPLLVQDAEVGRITFVPGKGRGRVRASSECARLPWVVAFRIRHDDRGLEQPDTDAVRPDPDLVAGDIQVDDGHRVLAHGVTWA
jgi:hypothetical protein